jgi:hypothetical protein
MNYYTKTSDVWYSKVWAHLQVLFESLFCLTKLLIKAVVQNVKVMLGQTLNYLCQIV